MQHHPDALLPKQELSLRQFNNLASGFHDDPNPAIPNEDKVTDFVRTVLEGRYYGDDDVERRIYIDAIKGLREGTLAPYGHPPAETQYQLCRDYDSIIGYSDNLPYDTALGAFVVPPFKEGIRKNLHITVPITTREVSPPPSASRPCSKPTCQGERLRVDIGSIPNMPFAKVGDHGTCNIAFPAVYGHSQRGVIERDLCCLFYDRVLRPVLHTVDLDHIAHWPPSYQAAEERIRDNHGEYHFGTVQLPAHCLADIVHGMKEKMQAIPSFRGAFFIHDVRGVKGESVHDPDDPDQRRAAMDDTGGYLDITQVPRHQFYVDVGLEIRRPGHVVQWDSSAHKALLQTLLPNTEEAKIEEILKSHKCIRDPNGLLTDFAGLRVSPGTRAAADGVVYINVYSTDKTIHYQLHQGVFQKHSPKDLLPGNISGVLKCLDRWTSCLNECMGGKDDHQQQEAAARCEVRVCLNDYSRVLVGWNVRDVNQFVSAVPARSWW